MSHSFDVNKSLVNAILTNERLSEDEKSELIARTMEEFKAEYPELKYHATKHDVRETELRLIKEIEEIRKEIKELDVRLTREIEQSRKEIKELDVKLSKEIGEAKVTMVKWSFLFWASQMSVMLGLAFFIYRVLKLS